MSEDDTSQAPTMRAALLTGYGAPLALETVPRPVPKADEVLVKIEASGVCFTDVHIWRGDHAAPDPLPLIMGHEGVGRVVALGAEEGRLKIGDRVGIGYVFGACGHCKECLTGGENWRFLVLADWGNMRCKLPNSRGCGLLLLISALKNFRPQNRWALTKQWLPTRRLVRLSKLWVARTAV